MRRLSIVLAIISLVLSQTAGAQVRGRGRLQGTVTDKATGQPIANATITIVLPGEATKPIVAKTNAKGHWAALGLTSGGWNIDIAADGYQTSPGSVNVSETQMSPPIRTELTPIVREEPVAPAAPAPSPLVPQEAADAINAGQELLKIKAGDVVTSPSSHTVRGDEVKENARQAAADFEKALPLIPQDKSEAVVIRKQLMQVMAQAYYRAGDLPKAIATLEQLSASDTAATADAAGTGRDLLLVNLYLEHGDVDKARALLEKLPPNAVSDPLVYTNIGILFLNKKNPADASTYFTKAITLDPKRAESYYYRGLAEVQVKKTAEARSDFQQVIALAPDSTEAHDAKQMLDALTKK
jgi:Flp pilus assembly protein TadD